MTAEFSPDASLLSEPSDPEFDTRATLGLPPATAARLAALVVSDGEVRVTVHSPLAGQPLGEIPQSTTADVRRAFARSRAAQPAWAARSVKARAQVLLDFHDLVLEHREELMDLIVWETGKARRHAFEEVMHVALTARYYGRTARAHLAPQRRAGVMPVLTGVQVNRVPKGIVGVISPWNYPFTMAISDALAAIVAGNGVVAKPDGQTMFSALRGVELLVEAGLPGGLWQLVAGPGGTVGPAVIEQSDYVCFTGSTATGRSVARACADRLIGCSLELGGKNPILILRDADIERAAEGAVRASFSNAGQLCVSTERMFVADQLYDRFVERFVARTESMTLGATLDWENDMGTLISAAQLGRVEAHVEDAVAHGAQVLTGGRARPDLAPHYFEPTILSGVTPQMACFAEETFGPVVSVYRFTEEDEAVQRANDGEYGLNASIYSRDTARARALAARLKCGSVNINEGYSASFASLSAPMGGMRASGLGRRQGAEGIHRFTEPQTVATQRLLQVPPTFGRSEQTHAEVMVASLKLLKRLGRA